MGNVNMVPFIVSKIFGFSWDYYSEVKILIKLHQIIYNECINKYVRKKYCNLTIIYTWNYVSKGNACIFSTHEQKYNQVQVELN